jgi:hypothetical protein
MWIRVAHVAEVLDKVIHVYHNGQCLAMVKAIRDFYYYSMIDKKSSKMPIRGT